MEQVVAAAVIDADGVVAAWSEGARLLTGHPAEEAVGRTAADLLAEDLPRRADGQWTGPVVVRHRDGHPVTLTVTACPVIGPDGRRAGYTVSAERPA
ncbi:PAS domain-containing protein, partial [Streptomyces sp. NPDC002491]